MVSGATDPRAHVFDCVKCEHVELRYSAKHVPPGWRRTDDGMICGDCAALTADSDPALSIPAAADFTGDPATDEQLILWMSSEARSVLALPESATNMLAAGALLGFRFGNPMAARGVALRGEGDARLLVRELLSQPLAVRADKVLHQ